MRDHPVRGAEVQVPSPRVRAGSSEASGSRSRRWVLVLALFGGLIALPSCITNPLTGRRSLALMGETQMNEMGLTAFQQTLAEEKETSNPEARALIERVGMRIAAVVDEQLVAEGREPFEWSFKVIESDQVNAWCLPGGKVAFYTGILPVCENEDGIAVVMGHEVAHAHAQHGNARMSRGVISQYGFAAVQLALGGGGEAGVQNQALQALGLATQMGTLKFSRGDESEADQLGLTFMAKAGYDPREAAAFWTRMSELAGGGAQPEILSTHPSHGTRISDIEKWLPEAMKLYEASPFRTDR